MRHISFLGLCLTVALAICGVIAVEASAAEDVYKQEKANLIEGETREITAKAATELTLKGEQEKEKVKWEAKCKSLKLNAAEHPTILGGTPGTSEKEKLEYGECSGTVGGEKCSGVEIEDGTWKNELVTITAPAGLKGKLATLFTPTSGTVLVKIKFKSCGVHGNSTAEVEGSTAAATSPEGVFEPNGKWAWSEKEQVTEVETHSGTKKAVGLKSGKLTATLSGEVEVKAALPWLSRTNVGGVPVRNEPFCEFTAAGEKCQIKFKNETLRTLAVRSVTIMGEKGTLRYKKTVEGCVFNLGIGECTDELEMVKLEAKTVNDYCMEVRDAGTAELQVMCAALKM